MRAHNDGMTLSPRLSDLPRDERMAALYQRAQQRKAEWQAMRPPANGLWSRWFGG